jgi:lipid-A-disaccharide synthase
MKYYIIAGEPSGDLYGSHLVKGIKQLDKESSFLFLGGDHMLGVDNNIVIHIRETSIMGFVEVVRNISKIRSFFQKAKSTILDFKPDVVVFIDYPGFNLRMAKWAKQNGYKTAYYISPQLWAWKKGRIQTIRKYVDEMIVILPFEQEFYLKNGIKAHYVGHPLLHIVDVFKKQISEKLKSTSQKTLAILPGSRKQEIKKLLPVMIQGASHFQKEYQLCVAMAPNIDKIFYTELVAEYDCEIQFVEGDTYGLLSIADVALVTSGTATLETALFGVPQVVCYRTSRVNYEIGRRLVDLQFISLVNLIGGKRIVPELIQDEVNEANIIHAINEIEEKGESIKKDYKKLRALLLEEEPPSEKAGKIIVKLASHQT